MNIDELISKYLDGELNEAEDQILRKELGDFPELRGKFDSSVEINSAIKQSAKNFSVPKELDSQTEDLIMMQIFAQDIPESAFEKRRKNRFVIWNRLAVASVVFFLFSIFQISDLYLGRNQVDMNMPVVNSLTAEIAKVDEVSSNSNKKVANFYINHSNGNNEPTNTIDVVNLESIILDLQPSDELSYNFEFDDVKRLSKPNFDIINFMNRLTKRTNQENNSKSFRDEPISYNVGVINAMRLNAQDDLNSLIGEFAGGSAGFRGVQLTPAFSTNNNFIGNDNLNIIDYTTYSQSFSFDLSENFSFGFEVGLNDFRYQTTTTILIPFETGIVGDGVEILDPAFEMQIPIDVSVDRNFQNFWGTFYLENRFSIYEDFYLNSRAGAGLSGGEWMLLAKLVLEYEVISGVSMLIGAETRSINLALPLARVNHQRMQSYGLNYGIKFNL